MFDWLKRLLGISTSYYSPPVSKPGPVNEMDEGDYHSGPYGYSPNTSYPETQYGSGFDEDAQWNEEH